MNKNTSWSDFEQLFATEIIAQAQRNARRWRYAWAITMIALVVTNLIWIKTL